MAYRIFPSLISRKHCLTSTYHCLPQIEEHVEEITTHHLTDDDHDLDDLDDEEVSDSGGSWRGSRCSLDDTRERRRREKVTRTATVAEDALLPSLNIPLPDPSHLASRRVSFPELGADIVHGALLGGLFSCWFIRLVFCRFIYGSGYLLI